MKIATMSLDELRRLRDEIERTVKDKENSVVIDARKEVNDILKKYGVTIDQVVGIKSKKTRAGALSEPKYRNPDDFTQTWTGKGRKPKWVLEYLDRGYTLDGLAIDQTLS